MSSKIHNIGVRFASSFLGILILFIASIILLLIGYFSWNSVEQSDYTFRISVSWTFGLGILGIVTASIRARKLKNKLPLLGFVLVYLSFI